MERNGNGSLDWSDSWDGLDLFISMDNGEAVNGGSYIIMGITSVVPQ